MRDQKGRHPVSYQDNFGAQNWSIREGMLLGFRYSTLGQFNNEHGVAIRRPGKIEVGPPRFVAS